MYYNNGEVLLDQKIADIAKIKFLEYYKEADIKIDQVEKREFGFGDFENKITKRHISFKTEKEFKDYTISQIPAFVSISSAFYAHPDARPMENKGWINSELVFDLDSSDLNLSCHKTHSKSWVCADCLSAVKNETIKLVENFLVPDFGISKNEITVNFSGNRGYHVHVNNSEFMTLDSDARKELSDYVTGNGINLNIFFPNISEKFKVLHGPKPGDAGWGGKFAKGVISALNGGESSLFNLGLDKRTVKKLLTNKTEIILGITTGNWDKIKIPKKEEFWSNLLKSLTINQTSSIDKNVTNEKGHLIRLQDTIHGDTALLSKNIGSVGRLEKFDPMVDAVLFKKGAIKIHADNVGEFSMNGIQFGPYTNQDVELPTYAALYLLLKRAAILK